MDTYTAEQAAERLGLSVKRIYEAVNKGQLAAIRVPVAARRGFTYSFTDADIESFRGRAGANGSYNSKEDLTCTYCGSAISRWPSKVVSRDGNAFCNRTCYLTWRHGKIKTM